MGVKANDVAGLKAKDIMRKQVLTVTPEMTLRELAALFIDRQISGAPVLDAKGRLVGVISQTDLVRRDREKSAEADVPGYYREGDHPSYYAGCQVVDPDFTRVADAMTPIVISSEESTPVEELARCMLQKHIHRIVITRSGKLCGIVTSMDMLRVLLEKAARPAAAARA